MSSGADIFDLRYWSNPAVVRIVEPNPYFVKYFEERRNSYRNLEVKDMLQVCGYSPESRQYKASSPPSDGEVPYFI